MTTQHDKAKRWMPWQFSLRALLMLMLVVASYLGGWMSNEWKRQREMERAKQEAQETLRRAEAQLRATQSTLQSTRRRSTAIPPAGSNGLE